MAKRLNKSEIVEILTVYCDTNERMRLILERISEIAKVHQETSEEELSKVVTFLCQAAFWSGAEAMQDKEFREKVVEIWKEGQG